jgi:uncharacterized protein (DUF885 family)
MQLRQKKAQDKWEKFDIKKFHEKVSESGVMPLALLESKIDAWIAEKNN